MASDIWKYFPGNEEPPSGWNWINFDDSSWSQGKGGIGYGDGDDSTVISQVGSVYMRIRFNIIDLSAIEKAILHVDFDDGFVAYLNGFEIARENIGKVGVMPYHYEFASSSREAMMPSGGIPQAYSVPVERFSHGINVLCLQVHNSNSTSSDLSSTAFLSAAIKDGSSNYRPVPSWFVDTGSEISNLPLISLETGLQSISINESIVASMKIFDDPSSSNSLNDPPVYQGLVNLKYRGQSTTSFPKKSMSMETIEASHLNLDTTLLGLSSDNDWVLYAPYSDKSLLRSAVSFYLGARICSDWQPHFRFCNLYLNNNFQGIYMLIEKIKQGKNRVDISDLKPDEITGNDLTGGYIVKVDKTTRLQAGETFVSVPQHRYLNARNYTFTYVYPDPLVMSSPQKSYIMNFIRDFQDVLNSDIFAWPASGYRKYIDPASFIDYQIIQELTLNIDGYRFSTYFYKEKDSKGGLLHAGPLWDFDLCYGNVNYSDLSEGTSGWLYRNFGPDAGNCMHWWARLMQDVRYAMAFENRWKELRNGVLRTDSVMYFIDRTVQHLGESVERNFKKWPILGVYVWPNNFVGSTHQSEVNYLKNWISARLDWIDKNITVNQRLFENTLPGNMIAYPNPVNDEVNIMFYVKGKEKTSAEILDILGKKVISQDYYPDDVGFQSVKLNTERLIPGYYILRIMQEGNLIGRINILKVKR